MLDILYNKYYPHQLRRALAVYSKLLSDCIDETVLTYFCPFEVKNFLLKTPCILRAL